MLSSANRSENSGARRPTWVPTCTVGDGLGLGGLVAGGEEATGVLPRSGGGDAGGSDVESGSGGVETVGRGRVVSVGSPAAQEASVAQAKTNTRLQTHFTD